MRYLLAISAIALLCSCGEFDNSPVFQGASIDAAATVSCVDLSKVMIEAIILPAAVQGQPWVGWLHGSGMSLSESGQPAATAWRVSGLPPGVALDATRGMLIGRPSEPGEYEVRVELSVVDCADAQEALTQTLVVYPACTEDCPATTPCDAIVDNPIEIAVEVVSDDGTRTILGPSESLALDDAEVITASEITLGCVGTSHRTILKPLGSKDNVILHYDLPGGISVPLDAQQERAGSPRVDLRYIHGDHGDHYLFLARDQRPLFVLYDGYLSAEELARRCPGGDGLLNKCAVPEFNLVPTTCASDEGRRPLSVEAILGAGATASRRRLGAGQAARSGELLLGLLSAWECDGVTACVDDYPPLHRVTFYEVPTTPPVCAVTPDRLCDLTAPAGDVVLQAGAVEQAEEVQVNWSFDLPNTGSITQLDRHYNDQGDELTFAMQLAGLYTFRPSCNVPGGDALSGRAEVHVVVQPQTDLRVEFLWEEPQSAPPAEDVRLLVKDDGASEITPRLQGYNLTLGDNAWDLKVRYPTKESPQPALTAVIRIIRRAEPVPEVDICEFTLTASAQKINLGNLSGSGVFSPAISCAP